ncbi:MAG: hypothetical protein ACPIOQ_35600 [Promethearchaeia archaeon]
MRATDTGLRKRELGRLPSLNAGLKVPVLREPTWICERTACRDATASAITPLLGCGAAAAATSGMDNSGAQTRAAQTAGVAVNLGSVITLPETAKVARVIPLRNKDGEAGVGSPAVPPLFGDYAGLASAHPARQPQGRLGV